MQVFSSFDDDPFPYRSFVSGEEIESVIIGVHGISGASYDYIGLGEFLLAHHPSCALYAYETRGQGLDPNKNRIGDIHHPEEWYRDLYTFTRLVRERHPQAHIIWCGESMGSLIALHAYAEHITDSCDGLILLAPVVKIGNQVPLWKLNAARLLAWLFPQFRIRLTALHGEHAVKVTQGSDSHDDQSAKNPWHIDTYTLRLLFTLGQHIGGMMEKAENITHPVLVINGGNDYFTPAEYTEEFLHHIPAKTDCTHLHLPSAYHLLMYDNEREKVFSRISQWIRDKYQAADQIS